MHVILQSVVGGPGPLIVEHNGDMFIEKCMSQEDLKKFVQLEDHFLQIELNSVCLGVSHTVEATALSKLIKDMFPKYNFAYHGIHLKKIAEPTKTVNTQVTC